MKDKIKQGGRREVTPRGLEKTANPALWSVVKQRISESEYPGSNLGTSTYQFLEFGANYFTPLSLRVSICKMGLTIVAAP